MPPLVRILESTSSASIILRRYPPPSGTAYSGSDSASDIDFYYDGGNTTPDHVQFFGSVSLTLGNSVTETNTPDGLGDGNDIFSYTYAGVSWMLRQPSAAVIRSFPLPGH